MLETFKASVQYNDWLGTSAADNADTQAWRSHLNSQGLIEENEVIIGIRAWFGENHPANEVRDVYVSFYVVPSEEFDQRTSNPTTVAVREIEIEVSPIEFVQRFKRLEICLGAKAAELDGKKLDVKSE